MVVKGAREHKVFEMKLQKIKKIQSQQLPLSKTALMHGLAWAEAPGPTPIGGPIMSCSFYFILAHDRPTDRRRPKTM
jgi:hypothetical protein